MAAQKQLTHPPEHVEEEIDEPTPKADNGAKLKKDIDDILDEIDDVLEANAESFVAQYVQKGGQ